MQTGCKLYIQQSVTHMDTTLKYVLKLTLSNKFSLSLSLSTQEHNTNFSIYFYSEFVCQNWYLNFIFKIFFC